MIGLFGQSSRRAAASAASGGAVPVPGHLETHTRNPFTPLPPPHFMSYPLDMTWILPPQVYFSATCHIHVISMSYLFQKRYIWIYLVYPKLKICIWRIPGISFHVICHAYPCPIHVISLSGCLVQALK